MTRTVLLLHSERDEAQAIEIGDHIKSQGYSVHSNASLKVGDSRIRRHSHLIESNTPVVFLGTAQTIGDENSRKMLDAARARNCTILPLRVERQAALDSLLPDILIADLIDDFEAGISELLDAIENHFSSLARMLDDGLAAEQSEEEKILPEQITSVVNTDSPVGKETELTRFMELLKTAPVLVLHGPPGQGKTTCARAIAARHQETMEERVCEVDLRNESHIEALPELIGQALGLKEHRGALRAIRRQPCFLLLDGFDEIMRNNSGEAINHALGQLLAAMGKSSKTVITCQNRIERNGFKNRAIQKLGHEACIELFLKSCESNLYLDGDQEEIGHFLETDLSGHPLSIILLAAYGSALGLQFAELRALWHEEWEEIASSPIAIDQPALNASFEVVYRSLNELEQRIVSVLSALPDGLDIDIVSEIWPNERSRFFGALNSLRNRKLLEPNLLFPSCHRLIGPIEAFARNRAKGQAEIHGAIEVELDVNAVYDYLIRTVGNFNKEPSSSDVLFVRQSFHSIHRAFDERLHATQEQSALDAAEAVLNLYWAYKNNLRGLQRPAASSEDAIGYLEKAEAVFVANGKAEKATECLQRIGNVYWLRGKIREAQGFLNDAVKSGAASPTLRLDCERAFAHMEYKEGSISRSVNLYEEVIKQAKAIDYEECVVRCQVGLLDAYRKLEDFEAVDRLHEVVVPNIGNMRRDISGNFFRGFAYAYVCRKQYKEAREHYENAIELFADNEFGLAHCHRGLGDICIGEGELDQAEREFSDAMELYREANKVPSLGVALVELGRARLCRARGQQAEALKKYSGVARSLGRESLNEPYEMGVAYEELGNLQESQENLREALGVYRIALDAFRKCDIGIREAPLSERINRLIGQLN